MTPDALSVPAPHPVEAPLEPPSTNIVAFRSEAPRAPLKLGAAPLSPPWWEWTATSLPELSAASSERARSA